MCVYSAFGDFYSEEWKKKLINPNTNTPIDPVYYVSYITRQEFDELKKQVEDMKKVLDIAAKYDKDTGQPECETEDKVALLKKLAKALGVDL